MATGAWLDRFQDPEPIRRRGLIDVYSCRDTESLEPRVVLVGSPGADRDSTRAALDAVAAAHDRIVTPMVARVDQRHCVGDIEYLSLHSDGVVDMERIFRDLSSSHTHADHGIGMRLIDHVHTALKVAHATPNPDTGRNYAMGALYWSSILFSEDGTPWLLGLGHNFPVRPFPRSVTVSPGMCEAPEVTVGIPATPPSDVWAAYSLLRSFAAFGELPQSLAAGLSGDLHGEWGILARHMQHTNQLATALSPAMRFQSIAELDEQYARTRPIYGAIPDEEVMRGFFGPIAQRLVESPTPRTVEEDLRAGRHWYAGRYRLERPLDTGASSLVWQAHDRELDQQVAMKVLRADCTDVVRRRFYREVRILRAAVHRHLVRGYDFFEEGGRLVAVMELVGGERFDQAWTRLDADPIVSAGADLLDGLAALHEQGVVHRDVKPQNIVMSAERGAVLVDFGIAAEGQSDLTLTGPVGTLGYMAPEQLSGEGAGPPADVFAMCTVLLEGLGSDLDALEPHVAAALRKGLRPEPERRPTAAEMSALLRRELPEPPSREIPDRSLRVGSDGRRFELPSGEVVDLSRRRAPRLLLNRLIEGHSATPGSPVGPEDLVEAGWPGERMSPDSARGRLYVAVYTLRKMGLDDVIQRVDDGYLIDPGVRIKR